MRPVPGSTEDSAALTSDGSPVGTYSWTAASAAACLFMSSVVVMFRPPRRSRWLRSFGVAPKSSEFSISDLTYSQK